MVLCGVSIIGFTGAVFLDVVTREIGAPWLWLQQVTTGFFAWGIFIGMAAAVRRNDHLYLVEITKRLTGPKRTFMESFNRVVVLGVALAMVWFGYKNAILDLGSFRMPSLIPLTYYTASVPLSFALMAGVIIATSFTQISLQSMVGQMFHGIDSETLLAVPFFLLVGERMK